jgi:hypothetical protein
MEDELIKQATTKPMGVSVQQMGFPTAQPLHQLRQRQFSSSVGSLKLAATLASPMQVVTTHPNPIGQHPEAYEVCPVTGFE